MAKKNRENAKNATKKTPAQRQADVERMMTTPEGRMMIERVAAWWGEVQEAADTAADGEVLDDAETATIEGGRRIMRDMLEVMMMKKVRQAQEKKSRVCEKEGCDGDLRHRGNKKKAL